MLAAVLGGSAAPGGTIDGPGFVDATAASGLSFRHVSGAFGDKWMPESLGSGVAIFDADADGISDVLLVQGTAWPGHEEAVPAQLRDATMRLLLNRGDGTFRDATPGSGLDVPLYGFGAAPADYDGDGDIDLYVTAYGVNRLFRNLGGARFEDATAEAGVGHPGWSTSAAWLDHDGDGDLDLYVANYVVWSPEQDIWCSLDGTHKSYCTPESYQGEPSVLYRNEGSGVFVDATREAGLFVPGGKSLGVAVGDFNADGWPDLAVANDTEPNFLFENRKDGSFEEVGLVSGMAFDASGRARAGMGIDSANLANDETVTLAIGNFSKEMIGLFERGPAGLFVDVAGRAGVGRSSFPFLTFSLFFFDYDLDGYEDLFAVNGHLVDRINEVEPGITYPQRSLLYRNVGDGRLVEVAGESGEMLMEPVVGRGAAYADLDRDGDLDIVVTTNNGRARLLRNTTRDGEGGPAVLRVVLIGENANRQALGAWLRLYGVPGVQTRMVRSGSSYASQSELAATFGLGGEGPASRLLIDWPDGGTTEIGPQVLADAVDVELRIDRRAGVIERLKLGE